MSRALFGSWGASLSQEDFALAVAAVGVLGTGMSATDETTIKAAVRKILIDHHDIVPLGLNRLARLALNIGRHKQGLTNAKAYKDAWIQFVKRWDAERPHNSPFLRLEVNTAVSAPLRGTAPDPLWLLRLLHRQDSTLADSAYLRLDEPDRPIAWEWPLRVGVLGDARSLELANYVATLPWPKLVKVVHLEASEEDCDLLLLPDDLRGAVARVLRHPRRIRADCVLLVGGVGVSQERVQPLMASLRDEVLTGGVGVIRVETEHQSGWVKRLFEELSHDLPLDVALVKANRIAAGGNQAESPLLIASRRLMTNTRVSVFASRYGKQIRLMATARAVPPRIRLMATARAAPPSSVGPSSSTSQLQPQAASEGIEAIGAELETRAKHGEWVSESGDASDVSRMRERVEAIVGSSLPAERDGVLAAQATARDERRVNFTVTDVTNSAAPDRVQDRLATDHAYEMELSIGLSQKDIDSASGIFPTDKLPPSSDGHWLDVFFVPLVRAAAGRFHTPQQGRLFLPPQGNSQSCTVSFRTHGVKDEYRARLLITHENRVIQTLVFSSPLDASDRRFALDVENIVAPTFDPAWQGKPFDAAIVVNHASDGQAGFTAVVGKEVSFREPQGVDKLVTEVQRLLSAEATFPESRGTIDDPALLKLCNDLAHYGRSILKSMPSELQGRVPEGARIQIVEARFGAWLPVEIFYSATLPNAGATLCPNAHAALLHEDGVSHEACPHRDDREHHCPMRFWGFSSVIERQPALVPVTGADYTISVPRPGADRLDFFRSVLVGASNNVRPEDLADPGGVLDAVQKVAQSSRTVKNWDEWESAVEANSPTLLMLLPHSQEDPLRPGIPGLEIGGVLLTYPELESSYVAGPAGKTPVVLLLGCSTQLTDVPFLNFVEAFKREKAALVIGTLATIRGRRTVAFVSALLDSLKSAEGSERTFGDVFLETKRRLLAGGDGFVLSLTAYGDVGWRL